MNSLQYFKSPDVLVSRRVGDPGLALQNIRTNASVKLNGRQAGWWTGWQSDELDTMDRDSWLASFSRNDFVKLEPDETELTDASIDGGQFEVGGRFIKWYWETPDLAVLFNSDLMSQNNPLLVLSPYGSLCWHGIVEGWNLNTIRQEALRVFGIDEVAPFLLRLTNLGFIKGNLPLHLSSRRESIRKEFLAPDVQFQLTQSAIPWYCLWELCTTCDLRCKICYQQEFKTRGPDPLEAERIATQLIESGIFYVCLLGGEALLVKHLETIVSRLHSGGVFTKIITNGQQLTLERASSLANAGLNQVEVSFDGLTAASHERSRGPRTFERAVDALRTSREAGIPRNGVVWTVHSGNFEDLPLLPAFLEQVSVTECYLSMFKKTGLNGANSEWEPLTPAQIQAIHVQIGAWHSSHPHLSIVLLPTCSCGRTSIVIGANNDVRTCSFCYTPVGNVSQTSLLEVWKGLGANMPETGNIGYCSERITQLRQIALVS